MGFPIQTQMQQTEETIRDVPRLHRFARWRYSTWFLSYDVNGPDDHLKVDSNDRRGACARFLANGEN